MAFYRQRQAVTAQEWLRGATPRLRSGAVAERCNPTSKERRRRAERNYSTLKVRRGDSSKVRGDSSKVRSSPEEIPHVQGKEQWLHFAGAAVKRYPTSKVREIQGKTVDAKRGH